MSQLQQCSNIKYLGFLSLKSKKIIFFLVLFFFVLLKIYNAWAGLEMEIYQDPRVIAGPEVTLEWDPNSEPDLAGYRIFVGQSSGNYQFWEDAGNQTSYTVANLQRGTTYYFAATAYDIYNNESDFSQEVSCTIPFSEPASSPSASSSTAVSSLSTTPPAPSSSLNAPATLSTIEQAQATASPSASSTQPSSLSTNMNVENNLDNYPELEALYTTTTIEKPQGRIPEGITKSQVSNSALSPSPKVEENALDEYLEIGVLYAKKQKYEKAKELFQKVAQDNPSSAKAHNNLAFVYLKQEHYALAEKEFKEALRIDPASVIPYYNLACLYSRKGMKVEALIYLKRALKRDVRVKLWAMTDDDFDGLRSDVVFQELLGI